MLAPSDFAFLGSGCVSINKPLAPAAIPAAAGASAAAAPAGCWPSCRCRRRARWAAPARQHPAAAAPCALAAILPHEPAAAAPAGTRAVRPVLGFPSLKAGQTQQG